MRCGTVWAQVVPRNRVLHCRRSMAGSDDLSLGLTLAAVTEFTTSSRCREAGREFIEPAPIRGQRCPTTPDEVQRLLDLLDGGGAAFSNPFEYPCRRILEDKAVMRKVLKGLLGDRQRYPRMRVTVEMDASKRTGFKPLKNLLVNILTPEGQVNIQRYILRTLLHTRRYPGRASTPRACRHLHRTYPAHTP